MEILEIEESVCPRCTEDGTYKDYILKQGHCRHVVPRGKKYVYYKDDEEEEKE